jgi:hypothetical protein
MSSGLDMMGPERIPHPFAHAYSLFNLEAARMGKIGLANKLGVYGALTDVLDVWTKGPCKVD